MTITDFASSPSFIGIIGLVLLMIIRPTKKYAKDWFQTLSERTERDMEQLASLIDGSNQAIRPVPIFDILKIYFSSRRNRNEANHLAVEHGCANCHYLLPRIASDHLRVRSVLLKAIRDRIVGTVIWRRVSVPAGNLLWYFTEEIELLSQLRECCPEHDKNVVVTQRLEWKLKT